MKKLILAGLFFASTLFAQNVSDAQNKIYLCLNEIQISAQGIFVLVDNKWVQTSKLEADSSGVFVKSEQILPWYCERCGLWTSGWWVCEHCGNPK